jgi:N-acetylglucosamine kinase-like BadF-type ATPase
MRYFLGVDVGGTKSHAVIADENGRALALGGGGTGNHESIGLDGFESLLHSITHQALAGAGITSHQITGAGFGIAGYDWPSDREPLEFAIRSLQLDAPFALVNDATIALVAGAYAGWGVSIISGTGCNSRGRDLHGNEGRVTGEGLRMGEFGGGYDLVLRATQAMSFAWSRRGPKTRLTDLFIEYFGARDEMDLLEGICRGRFEYDASMALMVFDAANSGDAVAQDVVRWLGHELGGLGVGVVRQLCFEALEFDVVLAGSLFKGSPLLAESAMATVQAAAPGARSVHLTEPPVVGGVLLGMEQAGLPYKALRQTLIESIDDLIRNEV